MKFLQPLPRKAFSLIELLTAMGILSILMLLLTVLLDSIQKSWSYSESRISQFREARVAFDLMTKNISQATVNTYWDLLDEDNDGLVDGYYKTSELHFKVMQSDLLGRAGDQTPVGHAVFFQAPLGFSSQYRNLNNLFNGRGYFVAWGSDERFRPSFLNQQVDPSYRFRLFEFRPPAESNQVFQDGAEYRERGERQQFERWFRQEMNIGEGRFEDHLNPLASNIICIFISPRDSLGARTSASRQDTFSRIAPRYTFDSNDADDEFEVFAQQVPPLLRITMVAIDETSAVRLDDEAPRQMPELVLPNSFTQTDRYDADVQALVESLNERGINHKVFSSVVMLRSAKWTGDT